MKIFDYLYVDVEKIISIYSQMTGGVVEVIERNSEHLRTSDNKRSYDFKVFKHNAGGTDSDKDNLKETIKPHHALIKETEEALEKHGFLIDLNKTPLSLKDQKFRNNLQKSFCIKVTGRAVIEDYDRMKTLGTSFPEIIGFVNKSMQSGIKKSDAYSEISSQLEIARQSIRDERKKSDRIAKQKTLTDLEKELASILDSISLSTGIEQWVLDGFKTWVDTFLPGIINLRIYPTPERPDEHVFGHLKSNCFEDKNTGSFHFTYGSLPTEELTLVGIVTSVPLEEGEIFKPLAEFDRPKLADYESVEHGFRGLFRGFDGLEQMIRTCRYPRILVHPLTVYRSVSSINSNELAATN